MKRTPSDSSRTSRDSTLTWPETAAIQQAKKDLAKKKYRIKLDLNNFYFQHGMKRGDTAYLGVQHPFDGVLCYSSSPQGLKNSAEQCYNLLARVFGTMMKEGKLTRMADSVFPLGDSLAESDCIFHVTIDPEVRFSVFEEQADLSSEAWAKV